MEAAGSVFMLHETFDELAGVVAAKPDDQLALASLREHFAAAYESGAVDQVLQMAMTLGAMACMGHQHIRELANEMSALYGLTEDQHAGDDHHGHSHDHKETGLSSTSKKKEPVRRERLTLWSILRNILRNIDHTRPGIV